MARRHKRREARPETLKPTISGRRPHWRADGAPKVAYGSRAEALTVAEERQQESGTDLEVYRCHVCHAWHMGTNRGSDD